MGQHFEGLTQKVLSQINNGQQKNLYHVPPPLLSKYGNVKKLKGSEGGERE